MVAPRPAPVALVVDDSCHQLRGFRLGPDNHVLPEEHGIAGKARFVAEYSRQTGVPVAFGGYRCGWIPP